MKIFKSYHYLLLSGILFLGCACNQKIDPNNEYKPVVIPDDAVAVVTEQAAGMIALVDLKKGQLAVIDGKEWTWRPEDADSGIPADKASYFSLPSECKSVYQKSCILMTCSGGGVALVRIKDKKVLFYTVIERSSTDKKNPNPHSAEVMPDGNIAVACSDGGRIEFFIFDKNNPYVEKSSAILEVEDAHNIVWDYDGKCFWYILNDRICKGQYAFTGEKGSGKGSITVSKSNSYVVSSGTVRAHDMSPVCGERALYVTYPGSLFKFDIETQKSKQITAGITKNIKSISSGKDITIIQLAISDAEWWSDSIRIYPAGRTICTLENYEIYKSRLLEENIFSYGPEGQKYPF